MHICGVCGQACYCDGEDHESPQPADCLCDCNEDDLEDYDYQDGEEEHLGPLHSREIRDDTVRPEGRRRVLRDEPRGRADLRGLQEAAGGDGAGTTG